MACFTLSNGVAPRFSGSQVLRIGQVFPHWLYRDAASTLLLAGACPAPAARMMPSTLGAVAAMFSSDTPSDDIPSSGGWCSPPLDAGRLRAAKIERDWPGAADAARAPSKCEGRVV